MSFRPLLPAVSVCTLVLSASLSAQTKKTTSSQVPAKVQISQACRAPRHDPNVEAKIELSHYPSSRELKKIKARRIRSAAGKQRTALERLSKVDKKETCLVQNLWSDFNRAEQELIKAAEQSTKYDTKAFKCRKDKNECKETECESKACCCGCFGTFLLCLITG